MTIIIFDIMLIFIFLISIAVLVRNFIFNKKQKERYEDFLKSLSINDKFKSKLQTRPIDPFEEFDEEISLVILDIKDNYLGVPYVKVQWFDNHISSMTVEELYNDFEKI